jgi:hypothetical protein
VFFHKRPWIFTVLAFGDEFDGGGCREGDPVHAGAVEGIDEGRGVANEDEAIARVAARSDLSKDVREVVTRALAD